VGLEFSSNRNFAFWTVKVGNWSENVSNLDVFFGGFRRIELIENLEFSLNSELAFPTTKVENPSENVSN
jgi:hypothetical protein